MPDSCLGTLQDYSLQFSDCDLEKYCLGFSHMVNLLTNFNLVTQYPNSFKRENKLG